MVLDCVQICLFSQFVELISLLIIQPQGLEQTGNVLFISGMNKLMDSLTDYNKICVGICSACRLRPLVMAVNFMECERSACNSAFSILCRI